MAPARPHGVILAYVRALEPKYKGKRERERGEKGGRRERDREGELRWFYSSASKSSPAALKEF